jgi:hypothetical protein
MKNLRKTKITALIRQSTTTFVTVLLVMCGGSAALGQRGMGDSSGIARKIAKPPLLCISGKLQKIEIHPCEKTTGKADLGAHLILKDEQGRELNIHLGPAAVLSKTLKQLETGEKIELTGFRTDKMSANHYVAQTLILDSHIVRLRDSDLRPYWAAAAFTPDAPSPSAPASVGGKQAAGMNRFYCPPGFRRYRCFQDEWRPRCRRRCRGRFGCRRFFTNCRPNARRK